MFHIHLNMPLLFRYPHASPPPLAHPLCPLHPSLNHQTIHPFGLHLPFRLGTYTMVLSPFSFHLPPPHMLLHPARKKGRNPSPPPLSTPPHRRQLISLTVILICFYTTNPLNLSLLLSISHSISPPPPSARRRDGTSQFGRCLEVAPDTSADVQNFQTQVFDLCLWLMSRSSICLTHNLSLLEQMWLAHLRHDVYCFYEHTRAGGKAKISCLETSILLCPT